MADFLIAALNGFDEVHAARLAADRWIERAIKARLVSENMSFVSNSRYTPVMGAKWRESLIIGAFLWVASALIALSLGAAALSGTYITTADVSLRSGPGMNYPVVTTLPKGIKINVVGRQGYWLKVESKHGDAPGYIDEQFAAPGGSPENNAAQRPQLRGAYRTLVDVDLRQGPGAKYPVVARLPSGIRVNVVRADGDWLFVESKHGGKPGYLERRFVERWTEN